jgi:hypothetical protein
MGAFATTSPPTTVDDAWETKPPTSVERPETAADDDAEKAPPTVVTPRISVVPVAITFPVNRSSEVMRPFTPSVVPGVVVPTPTLERKSPFPVTVRVEDARSASCTLKAPFTVEEAVAISPPETYAA